MALTDNCDLYAAIHEEGVNYVISHIVQQRPSLFNYATADVIEDPELWCENVKHTDDVTDYGNPLFTEVSPIPVIGADSPPVTLSFCAQLAGMRVDFHPGNVLSLPAELDPPLKEQSFAMSFTVCGAIGCPDDGALEEIPVTPKNPDKEHREVPPPVHVPGRMRCFCLDVYVVGHVAREVILGEESLLGKIDGIEIVDIEPRTMEDNIECYIKTAVTLVLRQKLAIALETLFIDLPLLDMATVTLSPTPNPPVANNPAIEEDQLKAFLDMTIV